MVVYILVRSQLSVSEVLIKIQGYHISCSRVDIQVNICKHGMDMGGSGSGLLKH
jgi:hypothetical protein